MRESGTVKFVLNGQPVTLDFHENTPHCPTTTLLQYLRSNPLLQGTKEGCAEGDCGACTVALVTLNKNKELLFEACDSCLVFLPMLHGKGVITVENIGSPDKLHPLQKAMVDYDGSQCGYCTPGFIMSLYSTFQIHGHPDRAIVEDALTGNLCRCTGYRSILEAAQSCHSAATAMPQSQQKNWSQMLSKLPQNALSIVRDSQKYFQPMNLAEALKLRCMYPEAIIINGATDIALRVTKNDEILQEIIDLSALKELRVLEKNNQHIIFGAGLCLEKVKQESQSCLPALFDSLKVFGSLQIRNLATLGGNIGSASPIGDTLPVLMAYGALVQLEGSEGTREMTLREFISGYRSTQLKPNEIIVKIIIPVPASDTRVKWYKISKRKDLDISSVSGGFLLELNGEQQVKEIELFYGGMAAMTSGAVQTCKFLYGKTWSKSLVQEAMDHIDIDFSPISDARAGAEGRRIMARNLLMKFWTDTNG